MMKMKMKKRKLPKTFYVSKRILIFAVTLLERVMNLRRELKY